MDFVSSFLAENILWDFFFFCLLVLLLLFALLSTEYNQQLSRLDTHTHTHTETESSLE